MRKNSTKNLRINEEVAHELAVIIRELKDPRIVYISVLGDEKAREDTMAGLKSAEGYVRRELAHSLNLRNTPQITFLADRSIERGVEMSRLIDEVCGKSVENEETE